MRTKAAVPLIAALMMSLLGASHLHAGSTQGARPATEYFGLKLGLEREEADERLERVGRRVGEEGREHHEGGEEEEGESWLLKDARFAYATIAFNTSGRLSWYTLFARRGGRPVLMRKIGDLTSATRKGNYIYSWNLPARSGRPSCLVIARSQNPDTLQSLSIAAIDAPASASAPPDSLR